MSTYQQLGIQTYYINESKNQVTLTNQIAGPITVDSIEQTNAELGEETEIKVGFTTFSPIP